MSFRSSLSAESGRLTLGGSLTIGNAARIREELISAFRESDSIEVAVMEDVVVDVSFMQILCSAKKTAVIEKKRFTIDWSAAFSVRQSIEYAGCNCDELSVPDANDDRSPVSGGENG